MKEHTNKLANAFTVLFLGVFAMPFFGGYLMFEEERETKIIGAILCVVGLVIWFMFGLK